MSDGASRVSALPEVRAALLGLQRRIGRRAAWWWRARHRHRRVSRRGGEVLSDRDTDERARRRVAELTAAGKPSTRPDQGGDPGARHARLDAATAPLRKADDAIEIDSSTLIADASSTAWPRSSPRAALRAGAERPAGRPIRSRC
jgi:cytidylate kinase